MFFFEHFLWTSLDVQNLWTSLDVQKKIEQNNQKRNFQIEYGDALLSNLNRNHPE